MDFALTDEQRLIVDTTRALGEGDRGRSLRRQHPEEFGGAGLDTLTWLLYERELGRASYALHWTCVARPSNILCAGTPEQREKYLDRCVRGET